MNAYIIDSVYRLTKYINIATSSMKKEDKVVNAKISIKFRESLLNDINAIGDEAQELVNKFNSEVRDLDSKINYAEDLLKKVSSIYSIDALNLYIETANEKSLEAKFYFWRLKIAPIAIQKLFPKATKDQNIGRLFKEFNTEANHDVAKKIAFAKSLVNELITISVKAYKDLIKNEKDIDSCTTTMEEGNTYKELLQQLWTIDSVSALHRFIETATINDIINTEEYDYFIRNAKVVDTFHAANYSHNAQKLVDKFNEPIFNLYQDDGVRNKIEIAKDLLKEIIQRSHLLFKYLQSESNTCNLINI